MKITVYKTNNGYLKPSHQSDQEYFNKMPLNEPFEIDYTKGRNSGFHRKFFALMNLAFENQECYAVMNDLREKVIIRAGYYREVIDIETGEIEQKAKSISFANMDELEFQKLYNDCKAVICQWIKIDNEMIAEEIEQYF